MSGDEAAVFGATGGAADVAVHATENGGGGVKSKAHPPDKYNLFLVILCWIGIGCLMPWNFFINATDYWMFKFRDVNATSVGYSSLQLKWNSYLSISNMIPNLMALFLNATV